MAAPPTSRTLPHLSSARGSDGVGITTDLSSVLAGAGVAAAAAAADMMSSETFMDLLSQAMHALIRIFFIHSLVRLLLDKIFDIVKSHLLLKIFNNLLLSCF